MGGRWSTLVQILKNNPPESRKENENKKNQDDYECPSCQAYAAFGIPGPALDQAGDRIGLEDQRPVENQDIGNQENDDDVRSEEPEGEDVQNQRKSVSGIEEIHEV